MIIKGMKVQVVFRCFKDMTEVYKIMRGIKKVDRDQLITKPQQGLNCP